MEMHKCFIFRHRFFVQPTIKLQKPVKIRLFANFKIGWLLWVKVLESNMPGDKHKEVDNFQILCVGLVFLGFHVRLNLKLCSERLISVSNSFTSGSTQEVSQNVRRHVINPQTHAIGLNRNHCGCAYMIYIFMSHSLPFHGLLVSEKICLPV